MRANGIFCSNTVPVLYLIWVALFVAPDSKADLQAKSVVK